MISQPLELGCCEQKKDFYICWLVTQWQYWCSSWNDFSTAWIKMMWAKKKDSISADLSLSGNIDVLREMISQPLELRWCEQKKKDFYLCWLVTQWQYWCSSWNDLSTAWIKMMWAKKNDYLCWLVTLWQYWCSSWTDLSTAWIKMIWAKKRLLSLLTCHSVAILMFFVEWSLNRLN